MRKDWFKKIKSAKIKIMRYKHKSYKTPNWHGLNNEAKKMNIADDFIKYNLTVKMIQETKICDNLMHKIKS